MSLKFVSALACAASVVAFSAADAATFTYDFSFTGNTSDGPATFIGSGTLTAIDNGDDSFTVTAADGTVSSGGVWGPDDTITGWWRDLALSAGRCAGVSGRASASDDAA